MSRFIMIRHGKTKVPWDEMSLEELNDLIIHKTDPPADSSFFLEHFDIERLKGYGIKKIFCSPVRRAKDTARLISEMIGVDVEMMGELGELVFDQVPKEVYDNGSQAIREFLVNESLKMDVKVPEIPDGSLVITHGFIMRHFYAELFDEKLEGLTDDERFKNYYCGFDSEGNLVTLKKN